MTALLSGNSLRLSALAMAIAVPSIADTGIVASAGPYAQLNQPGPLTQDPNNCPNTSASTPAAARRSGITKLPPNATNHKRTPVTGRTTPNT